MKNQHDTSRAVLACQSNQGPQDCTKRYKHSTRHADIDANDSARTAFQKIQHDASQHGNGSSIQRHPQAVTPHCLAELGVSLNLPYGSATLTPLPLFTHNIGTSIPSSAVPSCISAPSYHGGGYSHPAPPTGVSGVLRNQEQSDMDPARPGFSFRSLPTPSCTPATCAPCSLELASDSGQPASAIKGSSEPLTCSSHQEPCQSISIFTKSDDQDPAQAAAAEEDLWSSLPIEIRRLAGIKMPRKQKKRQRSEPSPNEKSAPAEDNRTDHAAVQPSAATFASCTNTTAPTSSTGDGHYSRANQQEKPPTAPAASCSINRASHHPLVGGVSSSGIKTQHMDQQSQKMQHISQLTDASAWRPPPKIRLCKPGLWRQQLDFQQRKEQGLSEEGVSRLQSTASDLKLPLPPVSAAGRPSAATPVQIAAQPTRTLHTPSEDAGCMVQPAADVAAPWRPANGYVLAKLAAPLLTEDVEFPLVTSMKLEVDGVLQPEVYSNVRFVRYEGYTGVYIKSFPLSKVKGLLDCGLRRLDSGNTSTIAWMLQRPGTTPGTVPAPAACSTTALARQSTKQNNSDVPALMPGQQPLDRAVKSPLPSKQPTTDVGAAAILQTGPAVAKRKETDASIRADAKKHKLSEEPVSSAVRPPSLDNAAASATHAVLASAPPGGVSVPEDASTAKASVELSSSLPAATASNHGVAAGKEELPIRSKPIKLKIVRNRAQQQQDLQEMPANKALSKPGLAVRPPISNPSSTRKQKHADAMPMKLVAPGNVAQSNWDVQATDLECSGLDILAMAASSLW